jgi:hypothetical protein
LAWITPAGFEAGPRSIGHGREHDAKEPTDRSLDPGCAHLEAGAPIRLYADQKWGIPCCAVERVERVSVKRRTGIRQQRCTERFAHSHYLLAIRFSYRHLVCQQPTTLEPGSQEIGTGEIVAAHFDVSGVDELLDQSQITRRGLSLL